MTHKITISFEKEITNDDLVNILSMAIDGGCSYWCEKLTFDDQAYEKAKSHCWCSNPAFEEVLVQLLINGEVLTWRDEDGNHKMSLAKLLKGIEKHLESGSDLDMDNWDANDGDCIIQYACFGKVIYG